MNKKFENMSIKISEECIEEPLMILGNLEESLKNNDYFINQLATAYSIDLIKSKIIFEKVLDISI